jgi:hypothetical protein
LTEAKNKELVKTLIAEEKQRHSQYDAESRSEGQVEDAKVR